MKDERAPNVNTPGFESGTQWSEVKCSTTRPSILVMKITLYMLNMYMYNDAWCVCVCFFQKDHYLQSYQGILKHYFCHAQLVFMEKSVK